MALPREQVEAEALELPLTDRARLAHLLIESLDGTTEDPEEVQRAWEAEIYTRLDEYRAGKARGIPAEDVFSEARRRRP